MLPVAGAHTSHHEGTHGGLNHFRIIEVDTVGRTDNVSDAEPGGNAYDGSKIPRVLNILKNRSDLPARS